ncbi:DMT family transporter [Acidaminobacter sp. JC074]|uniref:DMT family transporter n=1 Tax=Acidaminobacter sp. JC074 TaxID=2530199 RepID=UPI001F0F1D94|nr:DMT family transporter [Acidaminobacter sp. JC074]MCH4888402.1 DMT family transporter [Acidaminobacter sp. JC074]
MKNIKYEAFLIAVVAMWGLSFGLTKPLLANLGVFNFLTIRFIGGGLSLMLLLMVTKRFNPNKSLIKAAVTSGFLLFAMYYCHMEGLKYTSVAKNAFIVGSTVIFIPAVVYIRTRVKTDRLTWFQTIIAILGLALITLNDFSSLNRGDFITLIGTIIFAVYTVSIEHNVKKYDTDVFTAVQLTTVGVFSSIFMFAFETPNFDFTGSEWLTLAFLSLVLTGAFFYFLNIIQGKLSSSTVTLIFTLEPFFAVIFAWMLLKEAITMHVVTGGILIILSVSLPYLMPKRKVGEISG